MPSPSLITLLNGLHRFKEDAPEMPISILITLLSVAAHTPDGRVRQDPLSILELSKLARQPYTTTSRHLRYLGDFERPGVPGLDYVETHILPTDRRQKSVRLTPKGQRVIAQFKKLAEIEVERS
jgi:DNA-binding MarR family transcriptional regulator